MRLTLGFTFLSALSASVVLADQEASNLPHLAVDEHGRCYAKSVPAERYGQLGSTKVYIVEASEDRLVHTFDWYASELYIACNTSAPGKPPSIAVVRMGPWHRGHGASKKDLAIAIYWSGELVAAYSTLEISGTPENVSRSVSHYTVFRRAMGFEYVDKRPVWERTDWSQYEFVLEGTSGQRIAFHAATGKRLDASP